MYKYNSNCPLTFEEYTNKVADIEFDLIIGNERFDPSNKDEPIQRLITDQHYSSFSPKMHNYYDMFIGMNTYEIESGIFSSEKTGKFYTVNRERTFDTSYPNTTNKILMQYELMLDSKVKHYKSITYGIIDAIGTLGGVFEILLWVLMLFYGSIRENMYLFSVISTLAQFNQNGEEKSVAENTKNKDTPIIVDRHDRFAEI